MWSYENSQKLPLNLWPDADIFVCGYRREDKCRTLLLRHAFWRVEVNDAFGSGCTCESLLAGFASLVLRDGLGPPAAALHLFCVQRKFSWSPKPLRVGHVLKPLSGSILLILLLAPLPIVDNPKSLVLVITSGQKLKMGRFNISFWLGLQE